MKLVGMSTIFRCTKLRSFKCNDSWVVTTKYMLILNFNRSPFPYFSFFFANMVLLKVVNRLKLYQVQSFMVLRWVTHVLHSTQKFERPPFRNGCSYSIKNYGVEAISNGMTFLLNFIKSSNWFRSWWGDRPNWFRSWWGHRQTHRQENKLSWDQGT
jgi:hypothetical protein